MNLIIRFKLDEASTHESADELRAKATAALGDPPDRNPSVDTLEESIGEALAAAGVNVSEYDSAEIEIEEA